MFIILRGILAKPKADTKEQLPACPQPPATTKKVLAKGG